MRVLVTRPEPGASRTAARLRAAGHEALVLPLSETMALTVAALPDPKLYDAVAATSASAIRLADPALLAAIATKPMFVVGEKTGEAARKAGFETVIAGCSDGAALARVMAERMPEAKSVLYLAGRVRAGGFEAAAMRAGVAVEALDIYDTVPVEVKSDAVTGLTDGGAIGAVLVYSAEGATALMRLASGQERELLRTAAYLCISATVAEILRIPDRTIYAAELPSEDGIFALLEQVAGTRT